MNAAALESGALREIVESPAVSSLCGRWKVVLVHGVYGVGDVCTVVNIYSVATGAPSFWQIGASLATAAIMWATHYYASNYCNQERLLNEQKRNIESLGKLVEDKVGEIAKLTGLLQRSEEQSKETAEQVQRLAQESEQLGKENSRATQSLTELQQENTELKETVQKIGEEAKQLKEAEKNLVQVGARHQNKDVKEELVRFGHVIEENLALQQEANSTLARVELALKEEPK